MTDSKSLYKELEKTAIAPFSLKSLGKLRNILKNYFKDPVALEKAMNTIVDQQGLVKSLKHRLVGINPEKVIAQSGVLAPAGAAPKAKSRLGSALLGATGAFGLSGLGASYAMEKQKAQAEQDKSMAMARGLGLGMALPEMQRIREEHQGPTLNQLNQLAYPSPYSYS